MIVKPKIVKKGWGEEIWIHNDEDSITFFVRWIPPKQQLMPLKGRQATPLKTKAC